MGLGLLMFTGILLIVFLVGTFFVWYIVFLKSKSLKVLKKRNVELYEKENLKITILKKRIWKVIKWSFVGFLVILLISLISIFFIEPSILNNLKEKSDK